MHSIKVEVFFFLAGHTDTVMCITGALSHLSYSSLSHQRHLTPSLTFSLNYFLQCAYRLLLSLSFLLFHRPLFLSVLYRLPLSFPHLGRLGVSVRPSPTLGTLPPLSGPIDFMGLQCHAYTDESHIFFSHTVTSPIIHRFDPLIT